MEVASPDIRCNLRCRIDHGRKRPKHESEVGRGEILPEHALLVRSREDPLEELTQLAPRLGKPALGRRVAQEDLLQDAVARLQLECSFQEPDETGPRVLVGQSGFGDCEELVDSLGEDRLDERVPRREMPVQGGDAETGATRYLVEWRLDSPLCERAASGRHEQLVVALRISP